MVYPWKTLNYESIFNAKSTSTVKKVNSSKIVTYTKEYTDVKLSQW